VIRTREAELISKFVERAKQVKPIGQVVISDGARLSDIVLEDGDVVVIPQKTSLVLVQGEVNFPSAMVYRSGKSIDSYIGEAGGYSPSANSDQVLVMRRSGAVVRGDSATLVAGDEIFVMPKVDSKNMETAKTITQIMYQIAVSAKVVFGL
jgi:protein involved in polysaccharide export with SLBB domain